MALKFRVLQSEEKITLAKQIDDFTFVTAVTPELKCVRCHVLPIKHFVAGCQHLFCASCFNDLRNQKCPVCDENLDRIKLRKSDIGIEKQIFNLKVYCLNRKYGCQETIPLFHILEHQRTCPFPLINGNGHTNGNSGTPEPIKDSIQRLHEGLNFVIKDRAATKLREEMHERCSLVSKMTEEQLQNESKRLEAMVKDEVESLEWKLREEMSSTENELIAKESSKLKAEWAKDLSEVEENNYTQIEKLTDKTNKQEAVIEELKEKIDILSSVLQIKESTAKQNDDVSILVCGNSRNDFIQALANYLTYDMPMTLEDGGLIQLNPIYTTKSANEGDFTTYYQFPFEGERNLRILSWQHPTKESTILVQSNYHSHMQTINDFELLDNHLFPILQNQFASLDAIYFLLDGRNTDKNFLRLLHYIDRQHLQLNLKFILLVDEEESTENKTQTVQSIIEQMVGSDERYRLNEENVVEMSLQPFRDAVDNNFEQSEAVVSRWQNNSFECRRLINNSQSQSKQSLVNSLLATRSAVTAVNKLIHQYHQAIVGIVNNEDICKDIETELEQISGRQELLQSVWFNKEQRLEQNKKTREELVEQLENHREEMNSSKQLLERERDSMAFAIARLKKYFANNLLFWDDFLDERLWKFCIQQHTLEQEKERGSWISFLINASSRNSSPNSRAIAQELWTALKTAVSQVKLSEDDVDDGSIEEGFRIGHQMHRLLRKMEGRSSDI